MLLILRVLRILATSIFCIISFFVAATLLIEPENYRGLMYHIGGSIFVLLFLGHFTLVTLLVVTAILTVMDRCRVSKLWPYVLVWLLLGSAAAFKSILALPLAALVGVLYWALTGRVAGTPGYSVESIRQGPLIGKAIAAVAVGYPAYVLASWTVVGTKLLWVMAFPPGLGDPPYATQRERQMTAHVLMAVMDFPDAEACVSPDAGPIVPGKLVLIDWDRIDSHAVANVCIFRVLAAYGDLAEASDWFEGQGFNANRATLRPENPHVHRDGTLRVTASWSIKERGLRYVPDNLLSHAMASIAYGMSVHATWSEDGKSLLWIDIGFSTL